MKYFIHFFSLLLILGLFCSESIFAQEETGLFNTGVQFKGNNSINPDDVSGLPEVHQATAEEIQLRNEIRELRAQNDRSLFNRIMELENRLEALNPNSVSRPGEYYNGEIGLANNQDPPFSPDLIGNVEIFNSGSSFISSHATTTEQNGSTAGRIWSAFSIRSTGAADTIRVYFSDDNGANWTWYGWGKLGGTDWINYDQMDMEIIESSTGEKYVWVVYGYRNDAGTGRWRTGGMILQTPTFSGGFFALSWPGDDATKRYYRPRITSDNATYSTNAYVYMVASFDSSAGTSSVNTQKTLRCTNPYTVTPTFAYKADKFWWYSQSDNNQRDLHSDIAYFNNSSDSLIVSFSNVPDSTGLFFAKSDIYNGPGTADGAGGFIRGSQAGDYKQYARLSSNGNGNGSIICVFRQNTNNVWRIKYFRTINYGNFNSMFEAALQGSVTSNSWQPDIVGVRNSPKHYFAWRLDGSPDSLRYIGTTNLGVWPQNVGMMNGTSILSGLVGPKPGFRYAAGDSCFATFVPTGPFDVWAAYGCSPPVSVENTNEGLPDNYSLSQNYPNPFNPSTKIKFELPATSKVSLKVFNILGEFVSELVNQTLETGSYEYQFNPKGLTSGVYFYKLEVQGVDGNNHFIDVKKMILMK
jgi:hypothetical protein